jgi:hypothetical protein
LRQKTNLKFRETQMRSSMQSLISLVKTYKHKEREDKLYEQNLMQHLEHLEEEYKEYVVAGKVLEAVKPEFTRQEYSNVSNQLEEIQNQIDLVKKTSEHKLAGGLRLTDDQFTPYDVLEQKFTEDMQTVQTETARKMLHRLFKKTVYENVEMQTIPDDTPQLYAELTEKHEKLMEDYAKLQVQCRQVSDKQASSESLIKAIKEKLQITIENLKNTSDSLKSSEQEKDKLRSSFDEQKVKV